METTVIKQIMPGVDLTCCRTDKFKTGVLSVVLMTPLKKETASKTALVMRVLRRGTAVNPTMEDIAARLDELYGAKIVPMVRKKGEIACVGLYSSFPDDYFVEGESILEKTAALMGEILLRPDTRGGFLRGDYVESEKQSLIQDIQGLINEKGSYANIRLTELMCSGEAYGVRILGSESAVKKITAAGLTKHYKKLISSAQVQVFYCGSARPEKVELAVKSALADLPRGEIDSFLTTVIRTEPVKDTMREYTERMNVTQGKLSIGFRMGKSMLSPNYAALMLTNALYGGTVTSRLFMNVREKLSLCYYAHSVLDKHKGIMIVASGIAPENFQPARDEIFAQLEVIRRGEIGEDELEGVKRELITDLQTSLDEPYRLENYYLDNRLLGIRFTPDELAALVSDVTKEEVTAVATEIRPDCLYFLTAKEEQDEAQRV